MKGVLINSWQNSSLGHKKVCPDCGEKLRRFKKLIEIEFEIRRASLPSSSDLSTKHFERNPYEESYGICPRCKSAYVLTPGNPPQRLNDNIKNNITNDKNIFDNIIRARVKERIKNLKYRVLNIQTIDEGS
jgi:hypothetical protein